MPSDSTKSTKKTTAPEPVTPPPVKRLVRLPRSGKIAGVCAGLADYLDIDVTVMRVIFIILTLASGGFGIIVYFVLAVLMPTSEATLSQAAHGGKLGDNVNNLMGEMQQSDSVHRLRNYFGIGLMLFGLWLLMVQFFPQWVQLNWSLVWPIALVALGLILIARGRR